MPRLSEHECDIVCRILAHFLYLLCIPGAPPALQICLRPISSVASSCPAGIMPSSESRLCLWVMALEYADDNASEASRTTDVAIGILRTVSAIDIKAGRRHTCTLAAQRVLAAVIRNDPTAPSAAGAMSCLALGRRWTDNR